MIYYRGTTDFRIEEETAITFGKFDGVHRGHKYLMDALMQCKEKGRKTVVFTFDIPPRKTTMNDEGAVLTTNAERMHVFDELGVDYLVECPFTDKIRNMKPIDFIEMVVSKLHVKDVIVGTDFHFGYQRAGDYRLLQQEADRYGYEVKVVDKMQYAGRDISSTYVREELIAGHLHVVNELLGYPYFLQGEVEHGNRIGRTIGFPTINLTPDADKLLPPRGVYLTQVIIGGQAYCGITNVGCKPTIEGKHPIGVETHVIDFSDDIYDTMVKVEFLETIREEVKFTSVEKLQEQLEIDCKIARKYFGL